MASGDGSDGEAENTAETSENRDLEPSRQRLADYSPDAYTVGYDGSGNTRVGIGRAEGRIARLVRQNEGRHPSDGGHSAREAARDKKRITQSFCSALELTEYQRKEAVSVISRLNLDRFGSQKRLEKVALCVIQFVVDRDRQRLFLNGRDPSEIDLAAIDFDQQPPKLIEDPRFGTLCEEYAVSAKDRYSISQLIKRELKRREYFTEDRSG